MVKGGIPEQIDLTEEYELVLNVLHAIQSLPKSESRNLTPVLRKYPRPNGTFYAKSQLLWAYREFVERGDLAPDPALNRRLRGRPVRTISGVAPVAVLTEPYPCPGKCLFCPEQKEAPKSYLDGEPGVLRAIQNDYDPYDQTAVRIESLDSIGHPTDKIELLILGGTWSYYPDEYQEYFLRRCFDAMNGGEPSKTLEEAFKRNETAEHRNVGLVIETRPDWITPEAVVKLRGQGVTKVQLGAQSFDDKILNLNKRGHSVEDVRDAVRLLRLGGFKIVLHWMPNLYGATLESDLEDFKRLWDDVALRPDEMKIYPTALLGGTELYDLWQAGKYQPYAEETLIDLLAECKTYIQPYCRINRLMRDIPSQYIVAGTTKSNLRQIVQLKMEKQNQKCQCIRCREIRGRETVEFDQVYQDIVTYETDVTTEHFIQYLTPNNSLAGFLRLSLPIAPRERLPLPEIRNAAMVRELHVYGPAQALGKRASGGQHRGLGTQLLEEAAQMAQAAGFDELAVISAIGTRLYYHQRGFTRGELYPIRDL